MIGPMLKLIFILTSLVLDLGFGLWLGFNIMIRFSISVRVRG